ASSCSATTRRTASARLPKAVTGRISWPGDREGGAGSAAPSPTKASTWRTRRRGGRRRGRSQSFIAKARNERRARILTYGSQETRENSSPGFLASLFLFWVHSGETP